MSGELEYELSQYLGYEIPEGTVHGDRTTVSLSDGSGHPPLEDLYDLEATPWELAEHYGLEGVEYAEDTGILSWDIPKPPTEYEMPPIEYDQHGVVRFRRNALVDNLVQPCTSDVLDPPQWMVDEYEAVCKSNPLIRWLQERKGRMRTDLNDVALYCARNKVPSWQQEQLSMLIGYSVSGAGDLSHFRRGTIEEMDRRAEALIA